MTGTLRPELPHPSRIAVDCALAGIRAVDPYTIVVDALSTCHFGAPRLGGALAVVSIGKAAAAMARAAQETLGDQITRAILIAPSLTDSPGVRWTTYRGGHPIPTDEGERGARAILDLATSLGSGDALLCLISGGASALATIPAEGISLSDVQMLTSQLLRAGATIDELNCVRKHVDQLKGGRLARLASPACVTALVLSDVVGDPLDVIASGPTVPDPTMVADAIRILTLRGVWDQVPNSIRRHLERGIDESPKPGDLCFEATTSAIIGNNVRAAEASCAYAMSRGYHAFVITTTLTGEARVVGAMIARDALTRRRTLECRVPSQCLIYAGETTVTVTGAGQGGRNQELALAAALVLDGSNGVTITSIGTDGIDGPTDAAGAVADGQTLPRARTLGYDAQAALVNNDTYPFWRALGDLVMTGPTGTNVMDLIVVTIEAPL